MIGQIVMICTSANSNSQLQSVDVIEFQNSGLLNLADANLDELPDEKGFWGKVGDGFKDLGHEIGDGAKELGHKIGDGTKQIGHKIGDGTKEIGNKIGGSLRTAGRNTKEFFTEDFVDFWQETGRKTREAGQDVG